MMKKRKFLSENYFSGKILFILGSLYNKGNLFLINLFKSSSKGLNSVKNELTLKSILTQGCCAIPLEILATSENCLLSFCGLYPLAIKYCWYSLLVILNLLCHKFALTLKLHLLEPFNISPRKTCGRHYVSKAIGGFSKIVHKNLFRCGIKR